MNTVETCFKLTYTEDQYEKAVEYVEDMKRHKNRVYWAGKENVSEKDLVLSYIAHRILSGFYTNYLFSAAQIMSMRNKENDN
jgi:hypothetical protein